jgi:hypothetical protein
MAEVLNELDFRSVDEAIEAKRLIGPATSNITSFVETKSDWDEIPAEQPPRIDWTKINSKTPNAGGGFDWSRYKSEEDDDFFNFDDDPPDLVLNNKSEKWIDEESLHDDLSYYKNKPVRESWWDGINKNNVETSLDDLYNMIVEVQTRVDTMSNNVEDLTDMVKSQYKTMMNMINAIYKKINTA